MASIESTRGTLSAPPSAGAELPADFAAAVADVRAAAIRSEVLIEEVPPPRRVAPFGLALDGHIDIEAVARRNARPRSRQGTAEDQFDVSDDLADAGGRFVLLHDPAQPDEWAGDCRVIALVKAVVEPELVGDPMLADVAWSWLVDELDAADAQRIELGGTVTQVSSRSFGALASRADSVQVELRASWTPTGPMGRHAQAWAATLCRLAGVPPLAPGVITLPQRRR